MVTVTIDSKTVAAEEGTTIIQAAEKLGIEIPRYCYHPGLPVVGQCRMCQVEVEKAPKLAIACATPVAPGMVVHTNTPKVVKARKAVLEFYLLNHPLDCPICDKGGECPLQNYTIRYGPGESRFLEEKVKRVKALPLGPHVIFDAERCILCTRCIRFVQDVVGTGELAVFNRGDRVEIGLYPGKELDNLYSLNVVDLCPVGALTSRDYRFKARPWDLVRSVETICPGCSFGCNVILDVRHFGDERSSTLSPSGKGKGERILRIRPRVNLEVNGYFMCDIGRFTFKPLYQERLDQPLIRVGAGFTPARCREGGRAEALPYTPTSWEEALALLGSWLSEVLARYGPGSVGAILSSRLTNEELYLLQKFFRQVVGTESIDHRVKEVQEDGKSPTLSPPEKGNGRDYQEDHLLLRADRTPNTRGACDMGSLPGERGLDTKGMLEAARLGTLKALFIFEEDLVTDLHDQLGVREALSHLELLVVQALSLNETAALAHLVLPALGFAEKEGTFTNFKGRLQRLTKGVDPPGKLIPIPELLQRLSAELGVGEGLTPSPNGRRGTPPLQALSFESVWTEVAGSRPGYEGITWEGIPAQGLQPVKVDVYHRGAESADKDREF